MGQAAHTGDMRSIHKSLVGQPEEKGPHDRFWRIRNGNTKLIVTMKMVWVLVGFI